MTHSFSFSKLHDFSLFFTLWQSIQTQSGINELAIITSMADWSTKKKTPQISHSYNVLLLFLKWSPEAVGRSHSSCPDRPRHLLLSLSLRSHHSFHTITGGTAHSRGIINPRQPLTSDNLCPFISAGWRRGLTLSSGLKPQTLTSNVPLCSPDALL